MRIELLRHPPTPPDAIHAALVDALGPTEALPLTAVREYTALLKCSIDDNANVGEGKETADKDEHRSAVIVPSDGMQGKASANEASYRKSCEPRLRNASCTTCRRQRIEILAQLDEWIGELDEQPAISIGASGCGANSEANGSSDSGCSANSEANGSGVGGLGLATSKPEADERPIIFRRPTKSQQTPSPALLKERCWSLGSRTELRVVRTIKIILTLIQ